MVPKLPLEELDDEAPRVRRQQQHGRVASAVGPVPAVRENFHRVRVLRVRVLCRTNHLRVPGVRPGVYNNPVQCWTRERTIPERQHVPVGFQVYEIVARVFRFY